MVAQQQAGRPSADFLLLLAWDSKPAAPAGEDPNLLVARLMLIPRMEAPQPVLAGHNPDQGVLGKGRLGVLLDQLQDLRGVLLGPGILLPDDLLPVLGRLGLTESLGVLVEGVVVLL